MVYLDAVRGVALARVVLYHALGQSWVLVFSSLPLMFFVAGWLFAASLDRKGPGAVTFSRFRRIMPSYWVYVVAMVGLWAALGVLWELSPFDWLSFAMPVISAGGPHGPGIGTTLALTWTALWYLQMHLILALVGPWLRRAQQRHPLVLWLGLAAIAAVVWAFASPGALVFLFTGSWILGYHHHDGQLQAVLRRWWWAFVLACGFVAVTAVAVLFVTTTKVSGSAAAVRVAMLMMGVLGAFWLIVAIRLQPIVEPRLRGHRTLSTITWVSQRSLTIYLWHMAAIYVAVAVPLPGSSNWAIRIGWCLVGTLVAVLAFGWVEDLAGRRSVRLWPTRVIDLTVAGVSSADRAQTS
ncbi:MAG: acyltransferase [Actinobacteria bacterium]|nr:acyltransferase [Actinomycetota bacterium]